MSVRKIDAMHEWFGALPDKRCEDCSNLLKGEYHGRTYRKCLVYGASHSEATDWRRKYVACGMYNKEYGGSPVVDVLKCAKRNIEEEPLEGQVELF